MKIGLAFLLLLLLSGCFREQVQPQPHIDGDWKEQISKPLNQNQAFIPYETINPYTQVIGWIDDTSVILFEEDTDLTKISHYDIFSGEKTVIFESENMMLDVQLSPNRDIIVFQEFQSNSYDNHLIFLDIYGQLTMKLENFGEQYQVHFHPDKEERIVIVVFLPDWEFETYLLDISQQDMQMIDLTELHVEWFENGDLAYLKTKEEGELPIADLIRLQVEEEQEDIVQERLLAYRYLSDGFYFVVKSHSIDAENSQWTIFQQDEPLVTLDVPVLTTGTNEWWIPFYDFEQKNKQLLWFKPFYNDSFFHYQNGFELSQMSLKTGQIDVLFEWPENVPLETSPNGTMLLLGHQLEHIYFLEEDVLVDVFKK
ncbi:hypothetical protein [Alkalihalobacillus pseudalcaliphilus]|uniref:YqgU-like beta propeller domain-containing protein n=1 Tax=Alkalihalobacillus pseudalcaliphilus TaxID=79884 RepID=UPI00064DF22E|nr:hypothetical protein [Alkalihalobacillus pseudalcaliphilus]KMK76007.1 hypothetical protein AB990_12280 [Alkalihalobacillus pseudalcaliphilus]